MRMESPLNQRLRWSPPDVVYTPIDVTSSRMSQLAVEDSKGPDPRELQDKRRRLSVAFANGGFTYPQYYARLAEIDASLRLTESVGLPTLEEAAQLFEDIPQLWREATPEERRKLISPLIERVYVDMDCSMIGAIVPASAFRRLLEGAMARAESPAATLLSEDESERLKVWSWWRRGRVELHREHGNSVLVASRPSSTWTYTTVRLHKDKGCE